LRKDKILKKFKFQGFWWTLVPFMLNAQRITLMHHSSYFIHSFNESFTIIHSKVFSHMNFKFVEFITSLLNSKWTQIMIDRKTNHSIKNSFDTWIELIHSLFELEMILFRMKFWSFFEHCLYLCYWTFHVFLLFPVQTFNVNLLNYFFENLQTISYYH
jgi:hypothetical protein